MMKTAMSTVQSVGGHEIEARIKADQDREANKAKENPISKKGVLSMHQQPTQRKAKDAMQTLFEENVETLFNLIESLRMFEAILPK